MPRRYSDGAYYHGDQPMGDGSRRERTPSRDWRTAWETDEDEERQERLAFIHSILDEGDRDSEWDDA